MNSQKTYTAFKGVVLWEKPQSWHVESCNWSTPGAMSWPQTIPIGNPQNSSKMWPQLQWLDEIPPTWQSSQTGLILSKQGILAVLTLKDTIHTTDHWVIFPLLSCSEWDCLFIITLCSLHQCTKVLGGWLTLFICSSVSQSFWSQDPCTLWKIEDLKELLFMWITLLIFAIL